MRANIVELVRAQPPGLAREVQGTKEGRLRNVQTSLQTATFQHAAIEHRIVRRQEMSALHESAQLGPRFGECRRILHVAPGDAVDISEGEVLSRRPEEHDLAGNDFASFHAGHTDGTGGVAAAIRSFEIDGDEGAVGDIQRLNPVIHRHPPPSLRRKRQLLLIPIDFRVPGLAAHGDDVDAAVAVDVGTNQVFDRHTAVVYNLPGPLLALAVGTFIDPHAAPQCKFVAGLWIWVVADTDDQLIVAVAIEVGTPHAMAPAQLFVEDESLEQAILALFVGVNDDLVAVPRLDRGDELVAVL